MSKPNIVRMAQGYMKLECIPGHVGAHWRALVKVTDDDGVSRWLDIESGHEFQPDESGAIWADMETNIVYKSIYSAPLWFETGVDTLYVVEFDSDELKPIPFYEWPNIEDKPISERGILFWNHWSVSGISDPYLMRFVDVEDNTPIETDPNCMIGVWGTNSYRTTPSKYNDSVSDETEIP